MTYRVKINIVTRIQKRRREQLGYSHWWSLLDALDYLKCPRKELMGTPQFCDYELRRSDWVLRSP